MNPYENEAVVAELIRRFEGKVTAIRPLPTRNQPPTPAAGDLRVARFRLRP